jgi:hypothetical protein
MHDPADPPGRQLLELVYGDGRPLWSKILTLQACRLGGTMQYCKQHHLHFFCHHIGLLAPFNLRDPSVARRVFPQSVASSALS